MKTYEILDKFKARMKAAEDEFIAKEKELKKRLAEYEPRIDTLNEKLEAVNIQIGENRAGYMGLLKEEIDGRRELEAENLKLKEEHKKGEIALSEFMARSRTDAEIERISRSKIAAKIQIARDASRNVSIMRLEILKDIEYLSGKIALITQEFWRKYTELLSREKANLEKFFSFGFMGGHPHQHETNLRISTGLGLDAKNYDIQSWPDLEAIVCDGMIQPKHFSDFDRMILDLRSKCLDFEKHKLSLTYFSGTAGGHPEGFTWNVYDKIRPGMIIG